MFNYATDSVGEVFNAEHPVNKSPNNTGSRNYRFHRRLSFGILMQIPLNSLLWEVQAQRNRRPGVQVIGF